jgi:hypothetical protein
MMVPKQLIASEERSFDPHRLRHVSRETSTAGHWLLIKFSTTIGPALLSSSGFPRSKGCSLEEAEFDGFVHRNNKNFVSLS